jgi:hypothetical protein
MVDAAVYLDKCDILLYYVALDSSDANKLNILDDISSGTWGPMMFILKAYWSIVPSTAILLNSECT